MLNSYGENWIDYKSQDDFVDFNKSLNSYLLFKSNTLT